MTSATEQGVQNRTVSCQSRGSHKENQRHWGLLWSKNLHKIVRYFTKGLLKDSADMAPLLPPNYKVTQMVLLADEARCPDLTRGAAAAGSSLGSGSLASERPVP